MKTECVKNESTIVMFNSFQRNIICNAMNESILQVSQAASTRMQNRITQVIA